MYVYCVCLTHASIKWQMTKFVNFVEIPIGGDNRSLLAIDNYRFKPNIFYCHIEDHHTPSNLWIKMAESFRLQQLEPGGYRQCIQWLIRSPLTIDEFCIWQKYAISTVVISKTVRYSNWGLSAVVSCKFTVFAL